MSDLLREVDEAVRADNMWRLWNEHKNALIAGAAALILGTAAMTLWTNMQLEKHQKQTGQILTALESKDPAGSLVIAAPKMDGTSKTVAYLNAASANLKSGDKQKALENFTFAQSEKSADATFRDLATLQKTNLTLDLKPDVKAEDLLKEIEPIAKNKNSPWSGEALFMSAFIKGEKNKDYKSASADLDALQARDDVTQSIKQRAEALQSVYDLKSGKKS